MLAEKEDVAGKLIMKNGVLVLETHRFPKVAERRDDSAEQEERQDDDDDRNHVDETTTISTLTLTLGPSGDTMTLPDGEQKTSFATSGEGDSSSSVYTEETVDTIAEMLRCNHICGTFDFRDGSDESVTPPNSIVMSSIGIRRKKGSRKKKKLDAADYAKAKVLAQLDDRNDNADIFEGHSKSRSNHQFLADEERDLVAKNDNAQIPPVSHTTPTPVAKNTPGAQHFTFSMESDDGDDDDLEPTPSVSSTRAYASGHTRKLSQYVSPRVRTVGLATEWKLSNKRAGVVEGQKEGFQLRNVLSKAFSLPFASPKTMALLDHYEEEFDSPPEDDDEELEIESIVLEIVRTTSETPHIPLSINAAARRSGPSLADEDYEAHLDAPKEGCLDNNETEFAKKSVSADGDRTGKLVTNAGNSADANDDDQLGPLVVNDGNPVPTDEDTRGSSSSEPRFELFSILSAPSDELGVNPNVPDPPSLLDDDSCHNPAFLDAISPASFLQKVFGKPRKQRSGGRTSFEDSATSNSEEVELLIDDISREEDREAKLPIGPKTPTPWLSEVSSDEDFNQQQRNRDDENDPEYHERNSDTNRHESGRSDLNMAEQASGAKGAGHVSPDARSFDCVQVQVSSGDFVIDEADLAKTIASIQARREDALAKGLLFETLSYDGDSIEEITAFTEGLEKLRASKENTQINPLSVVPSSVQPLDESEHRKRTPIELPLADKPVVFAKSKSLLSQPVGPADPNDLDKLTTRKTDDLSLGLSSAPSDEEEPKSPLTSVTSFFRVGEEWKSFLKDLSFPLSHNRENIEAESDVMEYARRHNFSILRARALRQPGHYTCHEISEVAGELLFADVFIPKKQTLRVKALRRNLRRSKSCSSIRTTHTNGTDCPTSPTGFTKQKQTKTMTRTEAGVSQLSIFLKSPQNRLARTPISAQKMHDTFAQIPVKSGRVLA